MRALVVACALSLGLLAGCQKPAKVTQQEEAIAQQTTEQMSASALTIAGSRYRSYRWMTDEEMVRYRLGYDPTMSAGTRDTIEQAVDDDLSDKGFQRSEPGRFRRGFQRRLHRPQPLGPRLGLRGPDDRSDRRRRRDASRGLRRHGDLPDPGGNLLDPVLDARNRRLLWRGTGREHLRGESAQQSDEAIETAVYHALEDMPLPLAP